MTVTPAQVLATMRRSAAWAFAIACVVALLVAAGVVFDERAHGPSPADQRAAEVAAGLSCAWSRVNDACVCAAPDGNSWAFGPDRLCRMDRERRPWGLKP